MTPSPDLPARTGLFPQIGEVDRDRLGTALRRLVAHGAIMGLEPSQNDVYQWANINREWIEDAANLLDLKIYWDNEARLVQAVPQSTQFTLKLKLDATLVLLTLWYEFDTAVRDRGESPPVRLSVGHLNDSLKTKFEPLRRHLPSPTRLREILSLAQRKSLLRFSPAIDPAEAHIEILPTLKRVIPFQDLADWNRHADRHLAAAVAASPDIAADEPVAFGEASSESSDTTDSETDEEVE